MLIAASSIAVLVVVGCGDDTGTEAICALNEDFGRLNERTWDVIPPTEEDEPIPARYSSLLEENWVEGVKLMRQMVEHAPEIIEADLSTYTEAQAEMSEMYAEYDYIQADVWANADYETWLAEYAGLDEVRARIRQWFTDNCGTDLQG
jgi:hypothetical protein